ncbi:MAG: hypothetical protein EBT82_01545 [Micrococcales bacterium]|nr:hypothetical protein [Micrococcales bacterium]NBR61100.1 hypothetical protein [Actinomycetota bacterium]NBR54655.1 hypothetical protein [Micrococcales bacterium]NBT46609.1 hypothetical protein [Actinomycetota bacterium]NBY43281.1 hypothetical protein [Micrococcales bacterium]
MEKHGSGRGIGNLVIALYGVFALSATVRAVYQLIRKFEQAPVAYSLSLLAGLIYLLATVCLVQKNYRLAQATLLFELVGVISVGLLSIYEPGLFGHDSVWSYFGKGYGFIPLILPIFGLWWVRRSSR